jgi:hypothetical protein
MFSLSFAATFSSAFLACFPRAQFSCTLLGLARFARQSPVLALLSLELLLLSEFSFAGLTGETGLTDRGRRRELVTHGQGGQ